LIGADCTEVDLVAIRSAISYNYKIPAVLVRTNAGKLAMTSDDSPETPKDERSLKKVVGRRMAGGTDEAVSPTEFDALAEATTGQSAEIASSRQMGQDADRAILDHRFSLEAFCYRKTVRTTPIAVMLTKR
jgi:hypothetical protein